MKIETSEEEWLELVKQEARADDESAKVLLEFYYEIQHKAEEYIFFLKDGEPQFPKHGIIALQMEG